MSDLLGILTRAAVLHTLSCFVPLVSSSCTGITSAAAAVPSSSAAPSLPPAASISSIPLLPISGTDVGLSIVTSTPSLPSLPDISALLATPLTVPPVLPTPCRSEPLILSPALPPIPSRVVERVVNSKFIEFKEFLADNILLRQRLQELGVSGSAASAVQPLVSGSRLREVSDPVSWASCFLAFIATKVDHRETRELAAYGMIILQLATKHPGAGWRSYDRQFRQQKAAGADWPWADLNPSLMAATVLGQSSGGASRTCPLCLNADHTREECALFSLEHTRAGASPQFPRPPFHRQVRRTAPYGPPVGAGVCYRFNRGTCYATRCRFEHYCSNCSRPGHPAFACTSEPARGPPGDHETKSPPPLRGNGGRKPL